MADVAVAHPFVSTKADGADTTRVRPSNWNANHAYAGGADGDVPAYDAAAVTKATWVKRAKVLSIITTAVGNVGAGTDDLMSYTMPAATLGTDGQTLRITIWGTTAANANAKTIVLNFGATLVTINATTAAPNNQNWLATVMVVRTGAATQVLAGDGSAGAVQESTYSAAPTATLSGAVIIKVTGAATADNDIVQRGMLIEQLN
jgi:hypothetical protein